MARGTIYYVTTDKNASVSFTETKYYDRLDSMKVDYVKDMDEWDSRNSLDYLRTTLSEIGAWSQAHTVTEDSFMFEFKFDRLEEAQRKYFEPKLASLKAQVNALDLFKVIRSAPALDWMLDNEYGDLFEFHDAGSESLISMDDLIRRVKPGQTYYVYNMCILMH